MLNHAQTLFLRMVLKMSEEQTVNQKQLTISKLSALENLILLFIEKCEKEENDGVLIQSLSFDIAEFYQINKIGKGKEINFKLFTWQPYIDRNMKGKQFITRLWKSTFSRSIRRLVKRGLIKKEYHLHYCIEEWDKKQCKHFFKEVYLTSLGKEYLNLDKQKDSEQGDDKGEVA